MTETTLTMADAASHLPELVERLRTNQEAAIITLSGQPVARIVPIPTPPQVPDDLASFLRRWRTEYPEPDEEFGQAIEESRRMVQPPRDPWE
jgi:antitoxin (DNA-binding transcriptional repressor) of toxin-antitoxin stability system